MTQNELKELFEYSPDSGVFLWRKSPANNVPAGSVAGGVNPKNGYRYDGLFLVAKNWYEPSKDGPLVIRFELLKYQNALQTPDAY